MNNKKQKGFTLIEILVSVTILTIGLLGILAMHLRSHATVREAEKMGMVAGLTESLAESMRTNPTLEDSGVTDAQGNPIMKQRWSHYSDAVDLSSSACSKPTSNITASVLAQYHVCNFKSQFGKTVDTNYKLEICTKKSSQGKGCKGDDGDDYIISVSWPVSSTSASDSPTPYNYNLVVNMPHYKNSTASETASETTP